MFFFVNGLIFANWASRLPQLQLQYDLGHDQLGLILLSHAVGAFMGMPMTGWLIGKYSSRKVSIVAGLFFPLSFVMIPWMPSRDFLYIPFLCMGMSAGIMDVSMNAQAVLVEKLLARPIMTMFHAVFSLGMVAGGLIGGWFAISAIGLESHFGILMVVGLLTLLIGGRFLYPDEPDIQGGSAHFVMPQGAIIGLGVIAFCCMMGEGAMSDWSTLYMRDVVGAPIGLQTMGLTGFAGAMTVGRLFGDKGRTILGDRKMMLGGALISLAGMGLVLWAGEPFLTIVGFAGVGLGLSNIVPIVYSLAGSWPGIPSGVGIAMATTIGYTGFMFGPPMIGWIANVSSLWTGLGVLGVLFMVMTGLVLRHKR